MGLIDGEEAKLTGAKKKLLRERLLAEFIGTFFLVLVIGISVAGGGSNAPVAIGLLLGIQIYTFGSVSGGFFNPAVTLAVLLSGRGKITPPHAGLYMAVQFCGGLVGALIAFGATEKTFCFHYNSNPLLKEDHWHQPLILEVFFTMALCSTVLAAGTSYDAPNHYFGFAIGGTVLAGATACGGFDQGSFNPAVTFGINIANYFSDDSAKLGFEDLDTLTPDFGSWVIFLIAPLLGSVLAAAAFRGTRGEEYGLSSSELPEKETAGEAWAEQK
jgi:aquaporin Z